MSTYQLRRYRPVTAIKAPASGGTKAFAFFIGFFAHFSRLYREKPGYPGLRYRSGPGAPRRGRFAPLLSLAPQGVHRPSGGLAGYLNHVPGLSPKGAPLVLLGAFLAVLLGCKTVKPAPEPREPPMPGGALLFDRIEAEDVHRISLHFVLKVDNPRPLPARGTVEGWTLRINGVETREGAALSGAGGLSFVAEPGLPAEIPLSLDLDLDALPRGVLDWKNDLNLTADLALSYGAGSPVSISAGGTAEFQRIMEPVFTITGIAVLKAELINTRFRVSLRIDNPNPFPVELSAFSYELYGGGRFWADGEEKDILRIPAMSQADTRLFLVMNFIGMKRDLLDKVIYLRNVKYRFAGKAEVSTGIAFLPRFLTGFDLSGYSEVLE